MRLTKRLRGALCAYYKIFPSARATPWRIARRSLSLGTKPEWLQAVSVAATLRGHGRHPSRGAYRLDEALAHYRQALAIDEAQLAAHPTISAHVITSLKIMAIPAIFSVSAATPMRCPRTTNRALAIRDANVAAHTRDRKSTHGSGQHAQLHWRAPPDS